jgi:hypothetical protein
MESFREQRCRVCLRVFHICPCCDHGQVYCGDDCKKVGRDAQVRKAKRKYLMDEDVREGERERLRDYRARVPDHGSQKLAPDASVPIDATRALMDSGGDRAGGSNHASHESPVGSWQPAEPAGPLRPATPISPPAMPIGSPRVDPIDSVGTLPVDLIGSVDAPRVDPIGPVRSARAEVRCAFCGRGAQFVRFGPLRRGRTPRWQIRGRDP